MTSVRDAALATPVTIITGFLGSGKTTLLNSLLAHPDIGETAVLINEFGDIGVDHLLVREVSEGVVLLGFGCICCTVQGELVTTLRDLFIKRARQDIPEFRRVLIETTGLADPSPIIGTLAKDLMFKEAYRLDGIVTTVDAVNGDSHLDEHPEAVNQVAVADRIVITKSDLAEPGAIDRLQARLADLNPTAPRLVVAFGAVTPDDVFDAGLYDSRSRRLEPGAWLNADAYDEAGHGPAGHDHGPADRAATDGITRHNAHIASFSLAFAEAVEWKSFRRWLERLIRDDGDRLLRIKGIVGVIGKDGPFVVHCVKHNQHEPTIMPAWPDDDHRSRLVFITRDLDRATIEDALCRHLDGAA